MRVLFLTSSTEDYLSDSLLLGFRKVFGAGVVDYPKRDILYRGCSETMLRQVRGHGFTLYTGLMEEIDVDRFCIEPKLVEGFFDLVVVSDIWRQFGLFAQWRPYLNPQNTVLIDGADSAQVYPHAGRWWRVPPWGWTMPRATAGFLYFKREWTEDSRFDVWHRLLPQAWRRALPHYRGLRRISFAFPEEKIVAETPVKTKLFGRHVVDAEVAARLPDAVTRYAFNREADYYADLQVSRFAVTKKKAGWDCLRHYEIAANGCVPCFRDLERKPADAAPHGLVGGVNCVSYASAAELLRTVETITDEQYATLQRGALTWIRTKTDRAVAQAVVDEWALTTRHQTPVRTLASAHV